MLLNEFGDLAVRRINMAPLKRLYTKNLEDLTGIIRHYGFKVRIVGGAVRDVLIGRAPRDIDFITDALPDEVMYILEKHDFHYITKGIPHGTVKVKFSETEEYEITSIGYAIDDECCPEKIVVHSAQSWEGDAKRRDFTIDTLSVDLDGHLYDYAGGIADLRKQMVQFLGDPLERIKKDPVLILRFFKLLSMFKNPHYDKALIPILKDNMKLIKKLKPKRIALELSNIHKGPNADRVVKMMQNMGIDEFIEDVPAVTEQLHQYARDAAFRFLLEASPLHIVPALAIRFSNGRRKIVPGQRGDIHADIFDRLDPRVHEESTQVDGGFYDLNRKRYMSRAEALHMVGAGDSVTLRNAQQQAQPGH